jgi:hypothetical protein
MIDALRQKSGTKMKDPSVPAVRRPPRRKQVRVVDDVPRQKPADRAEDGYGRLCEQRERAFSKDTLRPSASSAKTIRKVMEKQLGYLPDLTLDALTEELASQCAEVSNGNLAAPEAMLMSQAQTCDAVFQHLTQQAYDNMNNIDIAERWFRLAFKAQSNSRASIETLGYLKNPTTVFAKQANMTTGPQQVNNNAISRTREPEIVQNELLERKDGKRLEPSTSSGAVGRNSELATVAKFNRTKDP